MSTWADDAAAALDALGDDFTPVEARTVTDRYPNVDVLAALASRGGGGGGAGLLKVASQHVTATEITAIGNDSTPVTVVAAPDSNTILWPQAVEFVYRAGNVAWDFDPQLEIAYETYEGNSVSATDNLHIDSTADRAFVVSTGTANVAFETDSGAATSPQGQALVLTVATPGPGTFVEPFGNGSVDVTVYYLELSLEAIA